MKKAGRVDEEVAEAAAITHLRLRQSSLVWAGRQGVPPAIPTNKLFSILVSRLPWRAVIFTTLYVVKTASLLLRCTGKSTTV